MTDPTVLFLKSRCVVIYDRRVLTFKFLHASDLGLKVRSFSFGHGESRVAFIRGGLRQNGDSDVYMRNGRYIWIISFNDSHSGLGYGWGVGLGVGMGGGCKYKLSQCYG